MAEPATIVVTIDSGPNADPKEIEELTIRLRNELLQLDVDDVERVREGEAPENAKGLELLAIGSLLVKLGPGVIDAVAGTLQAWLGRDESRSLKVKIGDKEIDVTDPTDDERRKLVEAFLAA